MVAPAAKREAVAHIQATLGMSERRACAVVGADRKSVRYRSCRDDDGDLRSRLRELAQQRRRFGYRRLHILLRRDGITINRKKTQRLYREEGLTVRRRKGRRRAVGARAPAPVLALPNQRWSLDFVHDQLATGRRFDVASVAVGPGVAAAFELEADSCLQRPRRLACPRREGRRREWRRQVADRHQDARKDG